MVVWRIGFDLPSFKYYCKCNRLFKLANKSIPEIPDNVATLNIYLTQVPVLSDYDRLPIIKQWLKVLNSYPKLKSLLNELINKANEYYGLRLGKLESLHIVATMTK